jgi:hypothetical protein
VTIFRLTTVVATLKMEFINIGNHLTPLTSQTVHKSKTKRETRIMAILQFISSAVWKSLFGRPADSLEKSIDHADEYMIFDCNPITSNFVSVHQSSADAYISGIIAGVLEGAGFSARVSAHTVDVEEGESRNGYIGLPSRKDKAVFLVKFAEKVLQRDTALER